MYLFMYKGIYWVDGNLRVGVMVRAGGLVTDVQCRG